MQIYVHRNNQQLGPFTEAEIKAQLASGATSLQDHVWWEGQANWIPLGQSPLAATLAPASPGPAPTMGSPLPGTPAAASGTAPETSKLAIWALVCGCLSLFLSLLASIPAIILGHMGLSQIKKNPAIPGRGMALTGMILGYVFTLLIPIISIIAISVLIALGNQVKSVFSTINSQLAVEQAEQSANSPDQTTNAPDQSTPAPAMTNSPDQSTNSAPATTNSADSITNSSMPSTNAPDSSTNSPATSTNAAPMSQ